MTLRPCHLLCCALLLCLPLMLGACSSKPQLPAKQRAKVHFLNGVSALNEGNPTQALQEFLQAEEADSDDPDIQDRLAYAYWQKQAYPLAEQHFLRAVALSSGGPIYYSNLGALYLTMGRFDDAVTVFRKAADNLLFSTPEVAWTGMGYAYFNKRDYVAAEQAYVKARELNPRYSQALLRLGELYYTQKRTIEALDAFHRHAELAPRAVAGRYWLGLTYLQAQNSAKARQAFEETVQLAPDSEQARLARGHLKSMK